MNMEQIVEPRMLLLEDDPTFASLLRREAEARHVNLRVCRNVDEMLVAVKSAPVDVAIIDYYLDEINGMTAAGLINEHIPVVLISATSRTIEDAKATGSCPESVRTLLAKNWGVRKIMTEALALVGPKPPESFAKRFTSKRALPWAAIATAVLWAALGPTRPIEMEDEETATPYKWDANSSPLGRMS
jgi:ActR/RegA family two-component response regulator